MQAGLSPRQVDRLPVFYKQRQQGLYPAWAYTLPTTFLRIFYSATEAGLWSAIVYWSVGFAPDAGRRAWPPLIAASHSWAGTRLAPLQRLIPRQRRTNQDSFRTHASVVHKPCLMHAHAPSAAIIRRACLRWFSRPPSPSQLVCRRSRPCRSHAACNSHGALRPAPACMRRFLTFLAILFLVHCNAVAMFRVFAALTRDMVVATSFGSAFLVIYLMLSGYILAKSAPASLATARCSLPCEVI